MQKDDKTGAAHGATMLYFPCNTTSTKAKTDHTVQAIPIALHTSLQFDIQSHEIVFQVHNPLFLRNDTDSTIRSFS